MKRCPNCKKEYVDSVGVCPEDGTFLEDFGTESEAFAYDFTEDAISHSSETVDRFGTAATETFDRDERISGTSATAAPSVSDRAAAATLSNADNPDADDYSDNPLFGWLVPLIIVILLIVMGFMFCSRTAEAPHASTIGIDNKRTSVGSL
jgi:hypothetical protein